MRLLPPCGGGSFHTGSETIDFNSVVGWVERSETHRLAAWADKLPTLHGLIGLDKTADAYPCQDKQDKKY